jgi:TetR/AcrR family transcriptional regulator, transcriptional repressor for nem operon
MRYSQAHKAQTRMRILYVAAAAIREHGIERVSLSEIMAGAKMTHGGFYGHFESKEDLIAEAIDFMFEERYAGMLSRVGTLDAKRGLNDFIDRFLSTGHLKTPEEGCPIPALAANVPHMSKDAKSRFSKGVSRLVDGLAVLAERAGVPNATIQANSILAELTGAINLARGAQPDRAKGILSASRQALKSRLGLGSFD